jgi:hypothetical protein
MLQMSYLTNKLDKHDKNGLLFRKLYYKLIICMPTVHIKQLKQYTKRGIRESG